jgi:hypothetical protein
MAAVYWAMTVRLGLLRLITVEEPRHRSHNVVSMVAAAMRTA